MVCTARAASAVRPAGLLRFPCGPAFSRSKEDNQMGWPKTLRAPDSPSGSFYMTSGVALTTSPSLSKSDCRKVWPMCTVATQVVFVILFGGITLYPEYPRIKIIIFTIKRNKFYLLADLLRERNTDLLLRPSVHSWVDPCMCPDWGLNNLGTLGRRSNKLSYLARASSQFLTMSVLKSQS